MLSFIRWLGLILLPCSLTCRPVAICKPGKPGLTFFLKPLHYCYPNFFHFGRWRYRTDEMVPRDYQKKTGWLRAWLGFLCYSLIHLIARVYITPLFTDLRLYYPLLTDLGLFFPLFTDLGRLILFPYSINCTGVYYSLIHWLWLILFPYSLTWAYVLFPYSINCTGVYYSLIHWFGLTSWRNWENRLACVFVKDFKLKFSHSCCRRVTVLSLILRGI